MPEAIAQKLHDTYGSCTYIEGYGLSEGPSPRRTSTRPHKAKKQCLGIPIFGVDSRASSIPTPSSSCSPGKVGEIVTCGPQVFRSYWMKAEANAECFVEIDGKRFFRTGDLGRTIDRGTGYFFLVDLSQEDDQRVGLQGVGRRGRGDALRAPHGARGGHHLHEGRAPWRERQGGRRREGGRSSHRTGVLHRVVPGAQHGGAYRCPRSVELVSSLPKTGSGKIMWRALQEEEDRRAAG